MARQVAQDNLMKARDERVALMNEVLGAIRVVKFMALERNFDEDRVLSERETEPEHQRIRYTIELVFNAVWSAPPTVAAIAAFLHCAL